MQRITLLCTLITCHAVHAAEGPAKFRNLRIVGEVATHASHLEIAGKSAHIIPDGLDGPFRCVVEMTLSDKAKLPVIVTAFPVQPGVETSKGVARIGIGRDAAGQTLTANVYELDPASKTNWAGVKGGAMPFHFWPVVNPKAKADLADLEKLKLTPRTWHNRKLRLIVDVEASAISFWLEGLLVHNVPRPAGIKGPISLLLQQGDKLHGASVEPLVRNPLYLPIDLTSHANEKVGEGKAFAKSRFNVGAVTFDMPQGEANLLSLEHAHWPEAARDPSSYYEKYDAGPSFLHDPRMPYLRVPTADYSALHVLAAAQDNADFTNNFTVQAGRYGYASQVVQYDFFGQAPRLSEAGKKVKPIETPAGKFFHVRVPIDLAFAQDIEKHLEFTLTKEIRLARRQPDPCRFRYRPLGLPSGVKIAALTLERSPLQLRVGSKEPGHAFEEPGSPTFQVRLDNPGPAAQAYTLIAQAKHLDGTLTKTEHAGKLEAGKYETVALVVPTKKRGYHDLVITLGNAAKAPILHRRTSFALLPPDTRKHRHTSPFGTWDFTGGHFTSNDPDVVGPLYVKLGLRFGMFGFPEEARKKYGIVSGAEPVITTKGIATYEAFREKSPTAPKTALLFHEHSISGRHVTRTPDLFHDLPPYKLDVDEAKRLDKMIEEASAAAKELRAKFPDAHIRLGNGALPTREEFYRRKFPADLFDSAGNETASFGRPPETQPPDWIANNACLWMDRQLLDAYGYKDKGVTQCYEICYPACNPGNVTLRTQADYLVRHAMHAYVWDIKEFRPGCISDMGNSYYYSNWGATGFCNKKPELNVKPSFVAFATMTRVLDGAKFARIVPLESPCLYGLEFDLPGERRGYVFWTLRGKRPLKLKLDGQDWTHIDDQANDKPLTPLKQGGFEITLSPSPVYVVGRGKLLEAKASTPVYDDRPAAQAAVVSKMTDLDEWTVQTHRDQELEYYTFITPRRKGDFRFTSVAKVDGKEGALKIEPQPIKHGKDTMPMYAALAHKKGLELPGTPTEIGMWVHGNSGWGRLMYELTDASGQRWISLGAQQRGEPTAWMADWLPKDQFEKWKNPGQSDWNTEDVMGISRINFDGWRYVAFPAPGNYPGEKYPWPGNSQWRWDKDGVVHYPLTLKRVVVELNEKVLHAKTYSPPPRGEIHVRDLMAGQGDVVRVKKVAWEERD